jgi:phage portal protein BeeE
VPSALAKFFRSTPLYATFSGKSWSEPPFWSLNSMARQLTSSMPDKERIENNFAGYVDAAYKADGIVFACIFTRMAIFAQARLVWQEWDGVRGGDLFGSPELDLLSKPWPNGTTGQLLAQAEVDVSLAGNYFATVTDDRARYGREATGPGRRITRMSPDRVTIIVTSNSGSPYALDAKIAGYLYEPPAGIGRDAPAVTLTPDQVIHYYSVPDPAARFRGMSWLTPLLKEIDADKAITSHKLRFFERGAAMSTVVNMEAEIGQEAFEEFVTWFKANHEGTDNAYKTVFLLGGRDIHTITADFAQLELKATQGAGETRIAAAAGVHPVIVGLSEGMQGAALNAGNFQAAVRLTANKTIRWLWQAAAPCFESVLTVPNRTRLWYDDRDIPFLREDALDVAKILSTKASGMKLLVDAGYEPDTVTDAYVAEDLSLLVHSGLPTVQLQQNGGNPALEPPDTTPPALPPGQEDR